MSILQIRGVNFFRNSCRGYVSHIWEQITALNFRCVWIMEKSLGGILCNSTISVPGIKDSAYHNFDSFFSIGLAQQALLHAGNARDVLLAADAAKQQGRQVYDRSDVLPVMELIYLTMGQAQLALKK